MAHRLIAKELESERREITERREIIVRSAHPPSFESLSAGKIVFIHLPFSLFSHQHHTLPLVFSRHMAMMRTALIAVVLTLCFVNTLAQTTTQGANAETTADASATAVTTSSSSSTTTTTTTTTNTPWPQECTSTLCNDDPNPELTCHPESNKVRRATKGPFFIVLSFAVSLRKRSKKKRDASTSRRTAHLLL